MFGFDSIRAAIWAVSAGDMLVSPRGERIPFARRALLFQQLFKMTPVEFSREFDATPEDVFISHGYLYVNGQTIQVEGTAMGGPGRDALHVLRAYLNTLQDKPPVELMVLEHNPETYQLLGETMWFEGNPRDLERKLLGTPDMSGFHSGFDTQVPYKYVPQKGGRPATDAPSGSKSRTTYNLSLDPEKTSPRSRSGLSFEHVLTRTAEALTIDEGERSPNAPSTIELLGYSHFGLPMVKFDGWEVALATDKMADKAAYVAIMDSLWAFNTGFLLPYMPRSVDEDTLEAIKGRAEDANPIIRAWVRDKRRFVEQAINVDGRGHFLAFYDGHEHRLGDYYLRVLDLPKEVLRALRITRGSTEEVYVYEINH
jgi:hypothetical protein